MAKKLMSFKTKGMNRDLSVSAFNPEFAFENMNLRLSTNDGNTLLSWVNEKGPSRIKNAENADFSLEGVAIGTAVLNHKLVVFTTAWDGVSSKTSYAADYIYVLEYSDEKKAKMTIATKYQGDLNFDYHHPLETLGSYESEEIQKVYWVDGKNQPRMINLNRNYYTGEEPLITYDAPFLFDFVPELQLNEVVTVQKKHGANGMFAPGVIQYAFTYYNKYCQESNIFYVTPLLYVSPPDRGGSPEEKVDNAFEITVDNVDSNFEYLRIYSIQRTSINGTPICKRIQDIPLNAASTSTVTVNYLSYFTAPTAYTDATHSNVAVSPYMVTAAIGVVTDPNTEWDAYPRGTYEDLRIVLPDSTEYTWGPNAGSNSTILITQSAVEVEGSVKFYVYEVASVSSLTPESIIKVIGGKKEFTKISYTDTGTSGESIDPTELLYKGGRSIIANTIEQKDNTLFLGNIKDNVCKALDYFKANSAISIINRNGSRWITAPKSFDGDYIYANQLNTVDENGNCIPCAGFKYNEVYRCGVQFQHKTGVWSSPVYINDIQVEGYPVIQNNDESVISIPVIKGKIDFTQDATLRDTLRNNGFVKARAVMAVPSIQNRLCLCQGVINPTLFTDHHRGYEVAGEGGTTVSKGNKDLYAQSSWFFRPIQNSTPWNTITGAVSPVVYNDAIGTNNYLNYTCRNINSNLPDEGTPSIPAYNPDGASNNNKDSIRRVEIQGEYNNENKFKIDPYTVTMHSPDLEFDTQLGVVSFDNTVCSKVGNATFKRTFSDIDIQTETPAASNDGAGFIHKAFNESGTLGIVSGLFYDDYVINDGNGTTGEAIGAFDAEHSSCKWMVYLWNKEGSLNNDITRPADKGVASAVLKKKIISNLRYASSVLDLTSTSEVPITIDKSPQLFSSDEATIVKLGSNIYMGNIDTALAPDKSEGMYFAFDDHLSTVSLDHYNIHTEFNQTGAWCKTFYDEVVNSGSATIPGTEGACLKYRSGAWSELQHAIGDIYLSLAVKKDMVRMKYKSTPHLVFGIKSGTGGMDVDDVWGNVDHVLPILEIRKSGISDISSLYGGISDDALMECNWIPCGEPVHLNFSDVTIFDYSYGDTYYQRYDCLKTYPFTHEDKNQVVEIGSFMLETHVNIDGRYDRNRGQLSNLHMSPQNFNLINPVYSQLNNFFSYKIMPADTYTNTVFPNQVTWSKTKESGANVDLWTNMTLASVLELDGDKGSLNKLIRLDNNLFAFQDSGISQILYNDNVQISSTDGVPIEIANSGKVMGKKYMNGTVGCSNKWSIVQTPMGIYFMDSNEKAIYLFNGQLTNISSQYGFNSWCKQMIPPASIDWDPTFPFISDGQFAPVEDKKSNFVGYYDKMNQDVLWINHQKDKDGNKIGKALAFSEKFGVFTSFYDYGESPFFCNLDDTGVWLRNGEETSGNPPKTRKVVSLWKHQAGPYSQFFGYHKPYWMTLVGNPEPQQDCIFTNLEFRSCITADNSGTSYSEGTENNGKFNFYLPFDLLETWNEYQHGAAELSIKNDHDQFKHHLSDDPAAHLDRKFRMWRCDIPRNNAVFDNARIPGGTYNYSKDSELGITRYYRKPNDRMRNPWIYIKLMKKKSLSDALPKAETHDIVLTYYD